MPRATPPLTVHLSAKGTDTPDEIAAQLVRMIGTKRLLPGDRLPSTRALAAAAGLPRSRVVAAYEMLGAGGFLHIVAGSGATVAADAQEAKSVANSVHSSRPKRLVSPPRQRPRPRYNLMPGAPDTSLIDERSWRQAWRSASREVPDLDWYHANEHPRLATALRDHLRQVRGVVAQERDIVIFPGATAAMTAVIDAVAPRRAAMEDPGYSWARKPLQDNVSRVDLVEVDDDGLRVERLRPAHRLVYVTPAHQYPLGGRMPVGRRHQLLQWARDHDAVAIEDDFDGEFRHDAAPLGPLRAMAGAADSVGYVGTASKTLTPQVRLAWAVVPPYLTQAVRDAALNRRSDACAITANALAHFIESGSMTRHLARTQRVYGARRRRLIAALAEQLPELRLTGADGGMHLTARWADGPDDVAVVAELRKRGVQAAALSPYGVDNRPRGLLLGYAQLPESAAAGAVAEIARALDRMRARGQS